MWPSQRGLAEKPILLINGEFRPETTRCSKCDHLLHDGSVRLDFMTDDVNEAEEMRIQTVAPACSKFGDRFALNSAGKFRTGFDTVSRAAICSGVSRISRALRLASR